MWPFVKKTVFHFGTTQAVVRMRTIINNGKKEIVPHALFFKADQDKSGKRPYRTEFRIEDLPELRELVEDVYRQLMHELQNTSK